MATRTYTESEILALALAALQSAYPGRSVAPGSFLYQIAASMSQTLAAVQSAIADADRDEDEKKQIASKFLIRRVELNWMSGHCRLGNRFSGSTIEVVGNGVSLRMRKPFVM